MKLADQEIRSSPADLSAFGVDMQDWVNVKCEVVDKHLKIQINEKTVYDRQLDIKPAGIVGLSYTFEGTGSVDYARLGHPDGTLVLADEFNDAMSIQ